MADAAAGLGAIHVEEYDEDVEQSEALLGSSGSPARGKREPRKEYLADDAGDAAGAQGVLGLLYGGLPVSDLPRVGWLSCTLACIIGGFWLLDSLKDAVLERTVGLERQPAAKLLSVVVTLLLVVQYNRLVDLVRKPVLFYILGAVYTAVLLLLSAGLAAAGLQSAGGHAVGAWKAVGMVSYVAIESYGSLTVALFWAFVNAAADLEEAKASYGLIIAGAQIGAILGSTAATLAGSKASLSRLFMWGALSPALTAVLVFFYVRKFGDHLPKEASTPDRRAARLGHRPQATAATAQEEGAAVDAAELAQRVSSTAIAAVQPGGAWQGAVEGLRLVFRHRFVLMILGVSCLYEVALTVLDYQMKVMGVARFREAALLSETAAVFGLGSMDGVNVAQSAAAAAAAAAAVGAQAGSATVTSIVSPPSSNIIDSSSEGFAALMGRFGQLTNGLSLLLSLLGTSLIVRRLGLPFTLTVFPALLVLAVVVSYFHPNLWVLFIAVSVLKGLTYALNEPCKEMLYMVTSDEIKFKAKAWIDVFGSRVAKGAGSIITGSSRGNADVLITYGSFAIFFVSLGLLGLSLVVGQEFQRLVHSGLVVGIDDVRASRKPPRRRKKRSRQAYPAGVELVPADAMYTDDFAALNGGNDSSGAYIAAVMPKSSLMEQTIKNCTTAGN